VKAALARVWRRTLRRLGPLGVAAVALLAAAALVAAWIPRLDRQGEQLREALAARLANSSTQRKPPPAPVPVGEQVREFVAAFPPLTQNAGDLDEVFQSAKRHNVPLLKGEYQFKQDPQAPLATYTATFPVHSQYGALKEFTADVLRALPNASMDELRMTRSDAGSTTLEAVVRFTFVYRST
jgi:hypothetical protein